MKIESYEAKDVVVTRQEIVETVASALRAKYNLPDDWQIVDHYWGQQDLTLVLQRMISKVDSISL
jgi:hypothetical protein